MNKPRLTTELLNKIMQLASDWETHAHENSHDEESHWDEVSYYRPVTEWANAELAKRKLKKQGKEMTDRMQPFAQRLIQVSEEMKSEENNND